MRNKIKKWIDGFEKHRTPFKWFCLKHVRFCGYDDVLKACTCGGCYNDVINEIIKNNKE